VVTRSPDAMAAGGEWGRRRRPGSDRAAPRRDLVGGGGSGEEAMERRATQVRWIQALNRCRRRFYFSVFLIEHRAVLDL